jgi:uncharacterized protein
VSSSGATVELVRGLAEVAAEEWDSVASDNVYLSHRWLSAVETERAGEVCYLLLRSAGQLVAALPAYRPKAEVGGRQSPSTIVGRDAEDPASRPWTPLVLAGAPIGYYNGLLSAPGLADADRRKATAAVLAELRRLAPNRLFPHLDADSAGAVASADQDGDWSLVFTTAAAAIPVRWDTFDGYLESLPRATRSEVRREERRYGERYPVVGREPLARCAHEMAPLSVALHAKYGDRADADRQRIFYAAVAAMMGDRATVFTCRQDRRLVGYCLGLRHGDTVYMRSTGFDYDCTGQHYEYFAVTYYEPIRYALDHGLARVHLGVESIDAKLRRGAELEPLWSAASRVGGLDRARLADLSRRRLAEWDEQVGHRLPRPPSATWQQPGVGSSC